MREFHLTWSESEIVAERLVENGYGGTAKMYVNRKPSDIARMFGETQGAQSRVLAVVLGALRECGYVDAFKAEPGS